VKRSTIRRLERIRVALANGEAITDADREKLSRFMSTSGASPPHRPQAAERIGASSSPATSPLPEPPPETGIGASPATASPRSSYTAYREKWQQRIQARDEQRWKRTSVPQGETKLVHVWAACVHAREIPPEACTLTLTRTNGEPYEILIAGETCCLTPEGPFPDRALYAVALQKRMQPTIPESFYGRITAPGIEGGIIKLGEGTIDLPPDPGRFQARAPWGDGIGQLGQNGAPWSAPISVPPAYPYGAPYGAPPGYGGAAPPAWFDEFKRMFLSLESKIAGRPSPPTAQTDPVLADAYRLAQEAQRAGQDNLAKLVTTLIERVTAPSPAAPAAAAPPVDQLAAFERNFDFIDRLMGRVEKRYELQAARDAEPEEKGLGIKQIGETTVVTSDGKIDPLGTAFVNLHGEVKGAVKKIVEKRVSGASPPKGAATTNLAAATKH